MDREQLESLIRFDYEVVNADDTISKVFPLLDKLDPDKASALVVKENGKIIGVIRERDLIRGSAMTNPHETKVKNFVIRTGIVDYSDLDVERVVRRFIEDSTPFVIVRKDGNYGVIYINDFLLSLKPELEDVRVREVMNPDVVTINAHDSAGKALSLMRTHGVDRLVVVDERHRVVGVITGKDIVDRIIAPRKRARMGDSKGEKEKTLAIMVESIMSYPPVTCEKDDRVSDVIDQMVEHMVSSVVVVAADETPEGIVTKKDILEKFLAERKPEGQLRIELIVRGMEIDEFDQVAIQSDVEKFMRKFSSFIRDAVMFIYIKQHKERFRGLPLIHVRIKLSSDRGTFFATGEGWGVEFAIHATLKKLEREILKEKELLTDAKMVKRFYEEVFEF
ncbi:putative transcriptional regulator, contains C-terminal CBS domain [Geoglobus ahangari]|uniref:Putative transcriptional regulator, contains C-terminal CBS domain n=1 Tax=Geoglobus ahangari TaxID=113653 RepID=A0A0F7IER8_9EURY|nr:CBS domain-containing protein [Geoglobus ahangari]AKG92083.1 putative transcriptional regulator, contains C-terminal CBS domain [Geoglobus ahangari]NOY10693.1 CBS domain-containing protein [Archaeoglobi archaeon]